MTRQKDAAAPATSAAALPLMLTVGDVGTVLRTTSGAIYAMIERGQLPGVVRVGRRVLVSRDILVAWLQSKAEKPKR